MTEPDLRSASDAAAFFEHLRAILVWLGVNDGNMEEGSLRCDANVSIRPAGTEALGTKAEVKNLNSFRFLQKALEYEIERQIDVRRGRRAGRPGDAAVRLGVRRHRVDAQQGRSARLSLFPGSRPARRSSSTPRGSRRFAQTMPELPAARRQRFVAEYGLPEYDAAQLTQTGQLSEYLRGGRRAPARRPRQ